MSAPFVEDKEDLTEVLPLLQIKRILNECSPSELSLTDNLQF